MPFFKKLKNNIGLEEKTKKKQDEEYEEENECQEEDGLPKEKNKKDKDKHSKEDKGAAVMEKSAFDWLKTKGQLAVDVFQVENEFCVQAPIAGIEQSDIDIFVENEMLIIKGERKEPIFSSDKEKKYFYQECYWGPFSRQIILPEDVNSEKIKASLKNGILIIRIPNAEPKKKKIIVELG
ncbi:hypothetical protein COT20_00410 [bacterium (Candidatus Gribaldobacteria) CG08_land_8_20_14_0_20_39_15]|uniref:SHSP domain-containing protein n=1 Tax=bacterium (Candidatus Gribaldobacteria) CG08_land_8_20_14_0_20_39_15 TaxID=2014273 RepID=A0A2M6XV80_9BACT|nr:MAG: hypothetical protein COT20_00410 [bacterium (Candidatus Gribaldobacteria) CG08_land_8_20_14_0_20_39_15]